MKLHFKKFYQGFCDGKVVVILISSKMNTYTCTFAVIKSEPAFQGCLKDDSTTHGLTGNLHKNHPISFIR